MTDTPTQSTHPAPPSIALGPAITIAIVVLGARVAALAGRETELLLDDAFISFRYAHSLASGLGLVFNPGERVEGYTNFLWTVLLAGGEGLGIQPAPASVVLAFVSICATIALVALLARRLFANEPQARLLVYAAPVLFASVGCESRYVLAGMETPLFALLVTAAAAAVICGWPPVAAGLLFTLAALTRPEGTGLFLVTLAYVLTFGYAERSRMRAASMMSAAFLCVFIPYTLWRWQYFGDLVPNAVYAKTDATITAALIERGWTQLLEAIRQSSFEAFVAVALLSLGRLRHEPIWLLLWALVLAVAAEMVIVGGDFQFFFGPRLLMPTLSLLCLLATAGLAWLSRVGSVPVGRALAATACLALAANAIWFSWPARDGSLVYVAQINQGWTELGKWLADKTPANAVVAVGAAGRIPYFSGRRTIDMLGLTDKHIARAPVRLGAGIPGHEKFDTPYVLRQAPDVVVFAMLDGEGQPAVQDWDLVRNEFATSYALAALVKAGPRPGPLVLETSQWSPTYAARGYLAGVFIRRAPPLLPGFYRQ